MPGTLVSTIDAHIVQDSAPWAVKCTPLAVPPAAFNARTTAMRRYGGTMNIMNPPPPAPETLPPIAPLAKARSYSVSIRPVLMPVAVRFFASQDRFRIVGHARDLAAQQRLLHLQRIALQLVQAVEDLAGLACRRSVRSCRAAARR